MHRYSSEQMEFLMALAGAMLFAGIYFPLAARFVRNAPAWIAVPTAAVPLVIFLGVLVVYWRRFRE